MCVTALNLKLCFQPDLARPAGLTFVTVVIFFFCRGPLLACAAAQDKCGHLRSSTCPCILQLALECAWSGRVGCPGESIFWEHSERECSLHNTRVPCTTCRGAVHRAHALLCAYHPGRHRCSGCLFSSPPGRRMFRLLTFFHEPSPGRHLLTHWRMNGVAIVPSPMSLERISSPGCATHWRPCTLLLSVHGSKKENPMPA